MQTACMTRQEQNCCGGHVCRLDGSLTVWFKSLVRLALIGVSEPWMVLSKVSIIVWI